MYCQKFDGICPYPEGVGCVFKDASCVDPDVVVFEVREGLLYGVWA